MWNGKKKILHIVNVKTSNKETRMQQNINYTKENKSFMTRVLEQN